MNSFGDVDYSLSGIVDSYEIIYRSPYTDYGNGTACPVESNGGVGYGWNVSDSYGIN